MQAPELIAMCAAKGIDLTHVGGNASNVNGIAAASRRKLTARGNGSRVYRRPIYSLAELGQAAQGVRKIPWLAAFYSWAGDRHPDTYSELFWALAKYADSQAEREHWPTAVQRVNRPKSVYVHELVGLVLEEEGDLRKYFQPSHTVHAIYMDVDEMTWGKHLASPYATLQQRYQSWLGTARSMIQRRISGES